MKDQKFWLGGLVGALGVAAAGTLLYYKNRQTIPSGVVALKPFNINRYLGRWYEICRMPMHYERGLEQVTAEYTLNADGSIKVVNSGYDWRRDKWRQATGRAVLAGEPNEGKLKVSFLGPFYAGYNVIAIDEDYKYALVFGRTLDYMWILSREKDVPEDILREYVQRAILAGYDYYRLIWTDQEEY